MVKRRRPRKKSTKLKISRALKKNLAIAGVGAATLVGAKALYTKKEPNDEKEVTIKTEGNDGDKAKTSTLSTKIQSFLNRKKSEGQYPNNDYAPKPQIPHKRNKKKKEAKDAEGNSVFNGRLKGPRRTIR